MSSKKTFIFIALVLSVIAITVMSFNETAVDHRKMVNSPKDSIGSVKAFMSVYKVLMSPRCMNCHPSGDVPLQGDQNRLHTMAVKRGPDGKGLYAMKCSNCHQAENTTGLHTPPGNPKWGLPPAKMRMVF